MSSKAYISKDCFVDVVREGRDASDAGIIAKFR
jgi:hypothetical protein